MCITTGNWQLWLVNWGVRSLWFSTFEFHDSLPDKFPDSLAHIWSRFCTGDCTVEIHKLLGNGLEEKFCVFTSEMYITYQGYTFRIYTKNCVLPVCVWWSWCCCFHLTAGSSGIPPATSKHSPGRVASTRAAHPRCRGTCTRGGSKRPRAPGCPPTCYHTQCVGRGLRWREPGR